MKLPRIASIHAGKVAPLGLDGVPSAFVKNSLHHPAQITPLGIRGDEQADKMMPKAMIRSGRAA